MSFLRVVIVALFSAVFCSGTFQPPHVVFILVDDLGWNDVSYHGSPEIPTPNIDALAATGVVLEKHYTLPQCTPSRGALMTASYPMRYGLQHHVIFAGSPNGIPLQFKILPQYLKDLGYATHAVGKWHLGYSTKEYTPTHRGFDSFFGYWNAKIDYYDYTDYEKALNSSSSPPMWGVDLHNGTEPVTNLRGKYATDLFTDVAIGIIEEHNVTEPLFLYLSHLACHNGNFYATMQAPPEYVAKFPYIADLERRTFAGMLSKLDESVGRVFQALHTKGMLDNTILVFTSDNGGDPNGIRGEKSSNWPLRSVKLQLFEGGVRVPTVIWSPLLGTKVSSQLVHITDWLPTLYEAAGGDPSDITNIDGMSMWQHLTSNQPSPRSEILLNIDQKDGTSALIQSGYKLIRGQYHGNRNLWYGASGREFVSPDSLDAWVWKDSCLVKDLTQLTGRWTVDVPDDWRTNLMTRCDNTTEADIPCNLNDGPCLFDLSNDPCERRNLAELYPEMVRSMIDRIEEYNSTSAPVFFPLVDPRANPLCHGFSFVSWLDEEHQSDCPYI